LSHYHSAASNTNDTTANRNGLRFPHPPINQLHHDNHRPTVPMHEVQPNPPRGGAIPLQPGLHILQSRGVMPERTLRHQSVHPFESAQIDVVFSHYLKIIKLIFKIRDRKTSSFYQLPHHKL